jgi:hypothetical protein
VLPGLQVQREQQVQQVQQVQRASEQALELKLKRHCLTLQRLQ